MNLLKNVLIAFVVALFGMESSAQVGMWVWQHGAYNRISVDSVTFLTHEYVDLGLKSGRLWATCNLGAYEPYEYGDLFAWGETRPKIEYHSYNYKFYESYNDTYTKYCDSDHKKVLDPEDDAATFNWGTEWRMPTYTEMEELYEGCTWTETGNYNGSGVGGVVGTSKTNGNTIFFPIKLSYSFYWTSSLYNTSYAYYLRCPGSTYNSVLSGPREDEHYIRAVKK